MIGERIKLKRNADCISLKELANNLNKAGCSITFATLSNYENGKTIPNDNVLEQISEQLGTSIEFFKTDKWDNLTINLFNSIDQNLKKEAELISYLTVNVEQQLSIDYLLKTRLPELNIQRRTIDHFDPQLIENTAVEFRAMAGVGEAPISSVCNMLENIGWYLFELPRGFGASAISGYTQNPEHLFLAFVSNDRPAELRYTVLKAVGTAYFCCENKVLLHDTVSYFAKAVLLPKTRIEMELGDTHRALLYPELSTLKIKYGLSRFRIADRLHDTGYLSTENYRKLKSTLKQYGYPLTRGLRNESLPFHELPEEYKQKILRARALGIISAEETNSYYPFEFY